MRLLDRYLLRELLGWLGYCLVGFLIFWIAFDLFSELNRFQERQLLARDIVRLYIIRLPEILVFILPVALLMALLYALTNHARHNEITAIRAAGISLWRLCASYFIVGLLFSLLVFVMNELWVPNSAAKQEEIMTRRLRQKSGAPASEIQSNFPFQNARAHRNWLIISYDSRTRIMLNPIVDWEAPDGAGLKLIAKRAEYLNGVWTFFDADEYRGDSLLLQTNRLAMPEFTETPEQINSEIKFRKRLRTPAVQSADIPILEILDYLKQRPDLPEGDKRWLRTQLHERFAEPWKCLVVVLIAIPFGAGSGRRNVFVGVAGCIVICFIYFVLQKLGFALGAGGFLTAWVAAWLPNVAFAIAGFWLTWRLR